MSRTTQFIGLSQDANQFLKEHNAKELCRHIITTGMFEEPIHGTIYDLEFKYDYYGMEAISNRAYAEVVQAEPWSSGPCIFTCLININAGEKVCFWSEEEIANYT